MSIDALIVVFLLSFIAGLFIAAFKDKYGGNDKK